MRSYKNNKYIKKDKVEETAAEMVREPERKPGRWRCVGGSCCKAEHAQKKLDQSNAIEPNPS